MKKLYLILFALMTIASSAKALEQNGHETAPKAAGSKAVQAYAELEGNILYFRYDDAWSSSENDVFQLNTLTIVLSVLMLMALGTYQVVSKELRRESLYLQS